MNGTSAIEKWKSRFINQENSHNFFIDHVISLAFPTVVSFNIIFHNVTSYLWRRSCFCNDVISCILLWYRSVNTALVSLFVCLFVFGATTPQWAMASSFLMFLDHTQRRTTVGRTPLDEWSARRRDFCLATHTTHNRQTSMPPVGFEPTITAGERPQTYAFRPRGHWDGRMQYNPKTAIWS